MWFLIKTGFWFSLVLVLLPLFSSVSTSRPDGASKVEVSDAFTAATGAFQYVSAICQEKPDVCVKGGETLTALGYRAREGALIAYQLLDRQLAGSKAGETPVAAIGSIKIDPATIEKIEAAAVSQPMPAKPVAVNETADTVVTGTVRRSQIPIPLPKPAI